MISKNKIKYIHSLENKKGRDSQGMFVAEGPKVVADILALHKEKLRMLVGTKEWLDNNMKLIPKNEGCEIVEVTNEELSKTSLLCHPQQVLAVFEKLNTQIDINDIAMKLTLVTDGVQDPGNLGTIIRIADWFGIENIICSTDTVDVYNPKVVQATMGSLARVNITYMDMEKLFAIVPSDLPVYGTLLEGKNIYEQPLTDNGLIIMGNEGNGLSALSRSKITRAIRIPNYPEGRETADSLNVAVATAIVAAEFRRSIKY